MAGVVPPITATAGSSFAVNFNGAVGAPVPVVVDYLGASALFSDFVFTDVVALNQTQVTFTLTLSNQSTAPLTGSQVDAIGFNTTPNVLKTGNTVSGAYDTVNINAGMPSFGNVEFCFSDILDCANSAGAGIQQGAVGVSYATLFFAGTGLTELTFDNMYLRYQNLTGVAGVFNGVGSPVPEPGAYLVLSGGLLLLALRKRLFRKNVEA